MARTIEELKRKAEQGSQQSQGEVLELELEELLRGRFPTDSIDPIGKGELGADVMQQVNGAIGQPAGIILCSMAHPLGGTERARIAHSDF